MVLKALYICTVLSLTLCATAIVVAYFWYTTSIPNLPVFERKVKAEVPPITPNLPIYEAEETLEGHSTTTNLPIYETEEKTEAPPTTPNVPVHKSEEKVEVPPLPETLPYAAHLKSIQTIQKASWTTQLYTFLKSLNHSISPQVNIVFGDSHHVDLVLNWIIAAHLRLNPPLHNIMVLSIDQPLCDLLVLKKLQVACIAVPPKSFLASSKGDPYKHGIKSRFIVLRIINYWGYDVASYDSDTVVLRNPQHLFESNPDVQVFSAAAYYPRSTFRAWGFSLCGGTLIVKSHPSTEKIWTKIHRSPKDECEQCLWNHAIQNIGLKWNGTKSSHRLCEGQFGRQSTGFLASIVFPQTMFCRRCCNTSRLHDYYVVHPANVHLNTSLKHRKLLFLQSWFLLDTWRYSVSSSLEGDSWLRSIYNKYRTIKTM